MRDAGEPHVLVDTREDSEWAAGPCGGRGAHEQGRDRTRHRNAVSRTRATTLVLYCGGGFRSALAADNLQKMGYVNVISLDGGWRALKESGLAMEK